MPREDQILLAPKTVRAGRAPTPHEMVETEKLLARVKANCDTSVNPGFLLGVVEISERAPRGIAGCASMSKEIVGVVERTAAMEAVEK